MIMNSFKQGVIDRVIEVEGGFVDDPLDSGGATKYGITEKVARDYGYKDDMQDLPREVACEIYELKYWDRLKLDSVQNLSFKIVEELFDSAVNMGVVTAAKYLQRSLNALNKRGAYYEDLVVDGIVGSRTIRALEIYINFRGCDGEVVLYNMLNCLQGCFYMDLASRRQKDEKFIYGWFKDRVNLA
jgi:lysozyme family protein